MVKLTKRWLLVKDTLLMMIGAAAGISIYIGACNMKKNKACIKKKMNSLIDEASDMFN